VEVGSAEEKEKSYLKIEKSKIICIGGGGNYSTAGEEVVRAIESRYRPSES
jgi:TPP-dependent trihydroxycyclohexane-1,2-dione (THcHDO) dehydratase